MDLVFRCLTCDQTLVAAHAQAARHARCPSCGAPARVPGPPAWRVDPAASRSPCPSCGATLPATARKCGRCGEILDAAFLARKAALAGLEDHGGLTSDLLGPPSGSALAYLSLAMACVPCLGFFAIFFARVARRRIAAGGAGPDGVAILALTISFVNVTLSLLGLIGLIASLP